MAASSNVADQSGLGRLLHEIGEALGSGIHALEKE